MNEVIDIFEVLVVQVPFGWLFIFAISNCTADNNKITIWKIDMLKSERKTVKERHSHIELRRQQYLFKSSMEYTILTISGIILTHS